MTTTRVCIWLAVLVLALCSGVAFAQNTLLLNHGSLTSDIGPNPTGYSNDIETSGKFGPCLHPHAVSGVSSGGLGFDASSYSSDKGTIEFWFKPDTISGTVIFCTSDAENGAPTDFFGLFQNWWRGSAYPLSAPSAGGRYAQLSDASQPWTWDTNRWYYITVTYKLTNSADDFVRLYIDGIKQAHFEAQELGAITSRPTGPLFFGGWGYEAYSPAPCRISELRIVDDVIYTDDFYPPVGPIAAYSDTALGQHSFADRRGIDAQVDEGNPSLNEQGADGLLYITTSATDYDTGGSGWTMCPVFQWNLDIVKGEMISSVSNATWRFAFSSWAFPSGNKFRFYRLTAPFEEYGINWANRPARDSSAWVDLTVTAAVNYIDLSSLLVMNGGLKTFGIEASPVDPNAAGGYFFGYSTNSASYWGPDNCNLTATYETTLPGRISGTINLCDYIGDLDVAPVRVELRESNTSNTLTTTYVTLGSNGAYLISGVATGTYDIAFTACKWLRSVVRSVTITSNHNTTVNTDVSNGDVDGDNEITSTDLSILGLGLGVAGDR